MGLCNYHLKTICMLVLTVLMTAGSSFLVDAQNTKFNQSSFSSPDSFVLVEDVLFLANNLSFLMNSGGSSLSASSCGKLLYKDRVRMQDTASGAVASFQTAFTFSMTGVNYWYDETGFLHGDGLAFTFTRNTSLLGQTPGSSMCVMQEANNGMASNRLFAVEFDTFLNYWWNDSSNSHIGVNINSMNSTWSYNLCGGNVRNCTYLTNGGTFTAWIDYDSSSSKLEVYFANGSLYNSIAKPRNPLIVAPNLRLDNLLDEFMYVGFSSSTGLYSEVHQIHAWQFASSGIPEQPAVQPPTVLNPVVTRSSSGRNVGVVAGACAGVGGALLLAGLFIARYRWRALYTKQDKFNLVEQNLVPRMFTYKELSKATQNFSRGEFLGSGGYGAVYKGVLPSGALVAVKRMRHESKHGEEGFQAEAASLSQIRHRNLVQLRGWCHEEEQLLLVYDFMCNGSLDEWLFHFSKQKGQPGPLLNLNATEALPLELRHSILSGVAGALSYLHEDCKQCVLHRDIKSSNVLLDEDLNAYLGDFGLARLIDHQKMEKTTMMAGTLGYMAPEMTHTGKATKESDVYSFGVLMLEVMCGMRPLDVSAIDRGDGILVDRVWRAHEAGDLLAVADSKLGAFPPWFAHNSSSGGIELQPDTASMLSPESVHDFDPSMGYSAQDPARVDKKMVASLLHLGLLCCNPNPEDRPQMRLVSQLLQSFEITMTSSLPPLPRCKPQARYSRPGFSHMAMIRSLSVDNNVREAAQPSSQSSTVSDGERANMQIMSFATTSSSVLSGR